MPERHISSVTADATRAEGRKIDSWRVALPDGKAEIKISMHTKHDEIIFTAKGDHPAIKGLHWQGTDLTKLRTEVMEDVDRAVSRYFSDQWKPAVAVEASLYKADRKAEMRVQLSIETTDIHVEEGRPIGNQGETHILKETTPQVMIQRSPDQVFEAGKGLDAANMRLSRERGNLASRAIVDAEHREAVLAISKTLEAFSMELMRRMSPDRMRYDGVPEPEDLALLMRKAIDEPQEAPEPEDEFRI
jgi:hypothetical protein